MNEQLQVLLSQAIALLADCGWPDEAKWFQEIRECLAHTDPRSTAFKETLRQFDAALAGMGSFTDQPLTPKWGPLTARDARDIQWRLARELGETIKRV